MVVALGHALLVQPLKGLETEFGWMGNQWYLCDGTPIQTLDAKALSGEFPWLATLCEYCHIPSLGGANAVYDSTGRGQLEVSFWNPLVLHPTCLCPRL